MSSSRNHEIGIDVESLDEHTQKMISRIIADADAAEVQVVLSNTKTIRENGQDCGGFFDEDDLILRVACKKNFISWTSVLAHESSHMDQMIEECASWRALEARNDPNILVDLWLDHQIEFTPEQLTDNIRLIRWHELDCEKRAIRKLDKFKVPTDLDICTQMANSYLYFHTMMAAHRSWYKKNQAPYEKRAIWSKMPKKFLPLDAYETLPAEYITLFDKYAFAAKSTDSSQNSSPASSGHSRRGH